MRVYSLYSLQCVWGVTAQQHRMHVSGVAGDACERGSDRFPETIALSLSQATTTAAWQGIASLARAAQRRVRSCFPARHPRKAHRMCQPRLPACSLTFRRMTLQLSPARHSRSRPLGRPEERGEGSVTTRIRSRARSGDPCASEAGLLVGLAADVARTSYLSH